MRIPIIIEPMYRRSFWCEQTLDGIYQEASRKKYELAIVDGNVCHETDYTPFFDGGRRLVLLIGTSVSWIPSAIAFFRQQHIGVVLISYQPPEHQLLQGVVRMDYVSAMHQLLTYFTVCDRPRVALYGFNPNSSADRIKQRYFASVRHTTGDVFYNLQSLEACFAAFLPHARQYDALICANDIVAVSVIRRLHASGLSVPDDMFVAGFGDSYLSRLVTPTITTASLDHTEMGREATLLYAHLSRLPEGVSASIRVASRLVVRASTANLPQPPASDAENDFIDDSTPVDFYADTEVQNILRVEDLVAHCDPLDIDILRGIICGQSYETLAETQATTTSTIRYRLRRMMQATDTTSREALLALIANVGITHDSQPLPDI